jgi:cellulose synthase/poly-beta-1,6-N-acetylglucosamine synthase-like glycosyltransferase
MALFICILSILYALFICWCIAGWMRLPAMETIPPSTVVTTVSVIIPARNEEENILDCLKDFVVQDFDRNSFEVIVINDHSIDHTAEIVRKFIAGQPGIKIKFIDLDSGDGNRLFKKYAITKGIEAAVFDLIITTDADCRRGKQWLKTIADYYSSHEVELISAPVFFADEQTWLEKIQSLEFLGLIAIGAAAIRNKMPFLCNGANLAFPKKVFDDVNGYHAENNSATGDDTQLMMKVISHGYDKIHFIKSRYASVTTKAQKTISGLLHQRQRWASKIPFHMNAFAIVVAVLAFLLHAGLLYLFVMFFISGDFQSVVIPLLIKIIPEFILLSMVCRFGRKSNLLYLFLPAQIIYPIYISFVGITSLFGSHQWKGRIQL